MSKEQITPSRPDSLKDTLVTWGKRLGLVAIGLLGLSWLL